MAHELLLNAWHRKAGATLAPWCDWLVPWRFGELEEEYQAVRRGAGLIDYSAWGLLEVRGADRVAFLHNLLTNDLKALKPGSGCEAGLLSPTAKLLSDLVVLADAEAHWILVNRSRMEVVLKTLDGYLITEDVTLHERTHTHALLALQGPRSLSVLRQTLGLELVFNQSLDHVMATVDTVALRCIAHSLTGEAGVLVVVPAEHAASLWNRFLSAKGGSASPARLSHMPGRAGGERGRPHGLVPVGWEALNVLRIEAGIPWYGVDMDESNLLPETGLEQRLVSFTKGCYVGQEVVARLQTYGSVSRKLMGIVCDGNDVPQAHDQIIKEGQPIGEITSACHSPTLNRSIAMGYVKRPFYEVGTVVAVNRGGKVLPATLVKLPFIQSTVHRPQSTAS